MMIVFFEESSLGLVHTVLVDIASQNRLFTLFATPAVAPLQLSDMPIPQHKPI